MSLRRNASRLLYAPWTPWGALTRRLRPRAVVLLYHRVAEPDLDPFELAVTPALFEEHLRALAKNFTLLELGDLLDGLESGQSPDGAVAITFDDGYADNLTRARPIAAGLNVPITVFVTTGAVFEGTSFWWDELTRSAAALREKESMDVEIDGRMGGRRVRFGQGADVTRAVRELHRELMLLHPADPILTRTLGLLADAAGSRFGDPLDGARALTPAELLEFAQHPGVTIGAHSVSHPSLRNVGDEECAFELVESRKTLEAALGRPVDLFAYPYGRPRDVGPATVDAATRAGFRAAFTTGGLAITSATVRRDPRAIPRLTAFSWPADECVRQVRRALAGARG